jgi:hypothetical protein
MKMDGPEDPERCLGTSSNKHCENKAVPGSQFCQTHGGAREYRKMKKEEVHTYKIKSFLKERFDNFADADVYKSLVGEIALLRVSMENIANICESENDLLIHNGTINSTAMTVRALVETMQKLEEKNKMLLSKVQVVSIANSLLSATLEFIKDPADRARLGEAFETILARVDDEDDNQ